MNEYTIVYRTESTMSVIVKAESEEQAISKLESFDIDNEPIEIDGGGFCEEDLVKITKEEG